MDGKLLNEGKTFCREGDGDAYVQMNSDGDKSFKIYSNVTQECLMSLLRLFSLFIKEFA